MAKTMTRAEFKVRWEKDAEGDEDSPRGYRPRPRSPWRSSDEAEQMVRY